MTRLLLFALPSTPDDNTPAQTVIALRDTDVEAYVDSDGEIVWSPRSWPTIPPPKLELVEAAFASETFEALRAQAGSRP